MASSATYPLGSRSVRPRSSPFRLPHRTSLYAGLLLGVAASVVPAAFVPQPGGVAVLKLGVATTLTLLPGWLYAVYLDRRGGSLYDEFVLNLFHLKIDDYGNLPMPPQHNSFFVVWKRAHDQLRNASGEATADNLYRRRFEGIYGQRAVTTREAFDRDGNVSQVETFSPVLLATLVIGIGWVLTLGPELIADLSLLRGLEWSGVPVVPVAPLQYAFIGAYAFTVQDLVRRYFVVDLRNTAYVSAISRIVLVTLIVAALYSGKTNFSTTDLAVAFGLGFFPRAALAALQARTVRTVGRWLQGRRDERLLGELDGMDIWQESRLVELGIENMQQFATADLVEILLRSRTPTQRLVHWLDRALLLLLLPKDPHERESMARDLLSVGVRYATDLDYAYECGPRRSRAAVAHAMGMEPDGLSVAIASLRRQRNYRHVAAFRQAEPCVDYASASRADDTRPVGNGHRVPAAA